MALYPDLSVGEHLAFSAKVRGCAENVPEVLDRVGLSYARDVLAVQLSTGMKIRLKLAMALQPDPLLLLLDEPSASLDSEGRELLNEICQTQRAKGCVILATNDPLERRVATHELVLDC